MHADPLIDSPATALLPDKWTSQIMMPRRIGHRLCGLENYLFSTGLLVDLSFEGMIYEYSARYCYEHASVAHAALCAWDGAGDPPGPWVKEKVSGRMGPGAQ